MEDTRSDTELVAASLADPEHFGVLIARYETKLRRYIRRLTSASPDRETDLLQDVFVKVYENLHGYSTEWTFSAWIYRITRNHVISEHRKDMSRPHGHQVQIEQRELEQVADEVPELSSYDASLRAQAVREVLAELPEKYREVVELFFFEHKSYTDIADILEISLGTVGTRINRAKKKLTSLLTNKHL